MSLLLRFGAVVRHAKLERVSKSVGIVILARLSSQRLPGKALRPILGEERVLDHILKRLKGLVAKDKIILATSDLPEDKALEDFAKEKGIACYRGSLERVGERFFAAAELLNCDYALRLNGDNILLDPSILKEMMDLAALGQYDFVSNVPERSFPKGMSVEIVSTHFYAQRLPAISADAYCNEHVMVCLYEEEPPSNYYYFKNTKLPEAAAIQLALDTKADFERSKWILEQIPEGHYDLNTTFEYYQRYEKSLKG